MNEKLYSVGPQLHKNTPNPFSHRTTISYELLEPGKVTLNVSNMLGREVQTLVNEYQNIGRHWVEFNPADLRDGIYLYSLKVDERIIITRKMLLY